nr:hypothetical protein MFLOJ_11610 [Mycobacterium florentinum]
MVFTIGPMSGMADAIPDPAVSDSARHPTPTASPANGRLLMCSSLQLLPPTVASQLTRCLARTGARQTVRFVYGGRKAVDFRHAIPIRRRPFSGY